MFPSKSLTVMFRKRFLNILYTILLAENIYKIIQATRFDEKCFINIYKIAEEIKVMLEMFFKHLVSTGVHTHPF